MLAKFDTVSLMLNRMPNTAIGLLSLRQNYQPSSRQIVNQGIYVRSDSSTSLARRLRQNILKNSIVNYSCLGHLLKPSNNKDLA